MQLMMPLVAVLEIAPAKVLQGAVRLHGSASLPVPATQVRTAWAWAGAEIANRAEVTAAAVSHDLLRDMYHLFPMRWLKTAVPVEATRLGKQLANARKCRCEIIDAWFCLETEFARSRPRNR